MREFWRFLMENKAWWITPTVLVFLALLALVLATQEGGVAPFIYGLW